MIIEYYFEKYGEPDEYIEGESEFIDPNIDRHWGYDVIEALWSVGDEKFVVQFIFMGGKGEYHYLVKIEFQDIDYEYF